MARMAKAAKKKEEGVGRQYFPGLTNWKYIAINAFLVFHILAISFWCLPTNSPFIVVCRNAVRPYFLWSGLFQSWDMFSPSPKTTNSFMEAIVLYKDGSTLIWSFPRMELLSLTDRYPKERYRKFVEDLLNDKNSALWPDVARYVARLPNIRAQQPQKVMLLVRWSDIVYHDDGTFTRSPWDEHVFYSYDVQTEDLQ
ncbi:MAG: hypothetical protein WCA98_05265 [Candidatus Acidiferrales bacterium]